MLTDDQRRLIRKHGIATLHDYRMVSIMNGEAFLDDGLLGYFDGRSLLVCAQPLRNEAPVRSGATHAFIQRITNGYCLESLIYVAPEPMSGRDLMGVRDGLGLRLVRDDVQRRVARSAELFLPVGDVSEAPHLGRMCRRAGRLQFVPRSRPGGMVEIDHLRLAERFYRGLQLTQYLVEVALTIPVAMTSPDVTIIEAWQQGTMKGFVTVHEPFDGFSVALFIVHDRLTPGVSDFLYSQLVDYARARRIEFVNVGPSPTDGHYAFKRKWCGVPMVPPYYAATWSRHPQRALHRTWLQRIIGRGR